MAPDESLQWYERALELLERAPDAGRDSRHRVELLVGLGEAQRRSGDPRFRQTLLDAADRADEIGAFDLLVRAALTNHRGFWSNIGGHDDDRVERIVRAIGRLESSDADDDIDRARLLALLAAEEYFQSSLENRERLVDEAISIARTHGDPAVLSEVLVYGELAVRSPVTLSRRSAWMEEAGGLADARSPLGLRFTLHANIALVALEAADLETVRRHQAICDDIVERTPFAGWRWQHTYNLVIDACLTGDLERAERLAESAFQSGTKTGQENADLIFGSQLLSIRYHQGRFDEMASGLAETLIERPTISSIRESSALSHARAGLVKSAHELLDQTAAILPTVQLDFNLVYSAACTAEAATIVGHPEAARVAVQLLAPYHSHLVTNGVTVYPAAAHYLGLSCAFLGRHDEAETWFTDASAIAERTNSPLLLAHTNAAWARMLVDRRASGDEERAHDLAEAALDTATRIGMADVARDAHAVLDIVGDVGPEPIR